MKKLPKISNTNDGTVSGHGRHYNAQKGFNINTKRITAGEN
jgi:hypothetical protein